MSYMDDQEDQSPMARARRFKEYESQLLFFWDRIARDWDTYSDGRAIRCGECHQSLYFTRDLQRRVYVYTAAEIRALTVAHIRQVHEKDLSSESGNSVRKDQVLDVPNGANAAGSSSSDAN